jgi:hypothetical protein
LILFETADIIKHKNNDKKKENSVNNKKKDKNKNNKKIENKG